jgi:hypothetical protein
MKKYKMPMTIDLDTFEEKSDELMRFFENIGLDPPDAYILMKMETIFLEECFGFRIEEENQVRELLKKVKKWDEAKK